MPGNEARHRADQHPRVVVLGRGQEVAGAPDLHDFSSAQDRDAVGDLGDDAEIVRDEEHAGAVLALQVADQREDLRLRRHVERGGRLVGNQQRGFQHQRHRDHDPLPLPAGELVRERRDHSRRLGQLHGANDVLDLLSARARL